MIEIIWDMLKIAFRFFKSKRMKKTAEQRLNSQKEWKPVFRDLIQETFTAKTRQDVIIRDVKRFDEYPDMSDGGRGPSSWFRAGLLSTYHRGILIGLHWNEIVETGDGQWRVLDIVNEDPERSKAVKVLLGGRIPFENIEFLEILGDEYYGYPHIYCHFSNEGGPYEGLGYYEEKQLFSDALPFYTEVVDLAAVREANERHGIVNPYL